MKLEEDISPNFQNMINLLTLSERKGLSVEYLKELEQDIIVEFGYEFSYPGPLESLERFLRLSNLHNDTDTKELCLKILKFQLKFSIFLNYKPS